MENKSLNAIRKEFIDFYVSKGHYAAKSASLVPKDDKSLLIINSGMAPLKKYFAGLEKPPAKRMTTCQKCVRTGDIENVGKTSRHGTFFEMLGNFSFGDYFKEESLTWGWEFIIDVLKLPKDKLWVTVYLDDDQAYNIWVKLGMPEDRIVRLGKEDNFWEIGLGPCGPCSEIYYDRGDEFGCGKPDCKPGCDCDRYVEFWNHVFTQFSREEDGSYTDLDHPNIDTGMGLERIACIMQSVDSIFDIDTIRYILDGVLEISGIEYEKEGTSDTDISVRIITDHLRSMVFMIADGINPSNEGRGYVLRRLIRRASRHGKTIGIKEDNCLAQLSDRVIEISGEAYPELIENRDYIKTIIATEEDRFNQTLDQGMEIIKEYIAELNEKGEKVLSGEKAFKLYDTYGFPLEVTEEILEENNFTLDKDGFNESMEAQKKMAREGRNVSEGEAWKADFIEGIPETIFTGYDKLEDEGIILAIRSENGNSDIISEGQIGYVYLNQSPFYAESGGQVYDTGFMYTNQSEAIIEAVNKSFGVFIHKVKVTKGEFKINDSVLCKVYGTRRNLVARNHTATHLLHAALREVLGDHVHQAGSLVTESILRFDFTHFKQLTDGELTEVENLVNIKVSEFIPVNIQEMSMDEANKIGAMALFDEKYGDLVRVVQAGNFSTELCGGTHVNNTGEIGAFHIISESGIASGVRRIEAITASGILELALKDEDLINNISEVLKSKKENLLNRTYSIVKDYKDAIKELEGIKKSQLSGSIDDIISEGKNIEGINLILKRFDDVSVNDLRDLSDAIKNISSNTAMVFAAVTDDKLAFLVSLTDDLVSKGYHAGNMIKEIAGACGGKGGGKANLAQAGANDISKIPEAFSVAESLIR